MANRCRVQVSGPLAEMGNELWAVLVEQGYTRGQASAHVRLMAHLSRWMSAAGIEPGGLGEVEIGRFVEARRAAGYRTMVSGSSVRLVVGHLRARGRIPDPPVAVVVSDLDLLLDAFASYLDDERCLAAGTVCYRVEVARRFLVMLGEPLPVSLAGLGAREVTSFLLDEAGCRAVPSAKAVATALRCLLRFLLEKGHVTVSLADAVPAIAHWRSSFPCAVPADTVERLLAGCDRRTAIGRRNYAILLVFARLGLRAGEVAALTLDDIDWRAGEVKVRAGKTRRRERMPLPHDVGAAIAGYLWRGRPASSSRAAFLRSCAPRTGLSSQGLCFVVRSMCERVGVSGFGPHRLRHTLASELLRGGASLPEIAQVLRQRTLAATAIYAKIDRAGLAVVARPWPAVTR
jgi:site-specific recombinase XerD